MLPPIFNRPLAIFSFLAALAAIPAAPASAQGLLGAIIDALGGRPPARMAPPIAYADPAFSADPGSLFGKRDDGGSSLVGGRGFCVRTCDGRYFPLQAGGAEMCRAMCPASPTMTFYGSAIGHAVAGNGARYSDLDTAFLYREQIVAGCTCNGKDAFGLARVDLASDPTLRDGDIVATSNGLMAYNTRTRRGAETASFTPVDLSRLARDLRERLANTKIADTQAPAPMERGASAPARQR